MRSVSSRVFLAACGIVVAALTGSTVSAADGAAAYAPCAACHGAQGEGNATLNAPRIAGQEAWYIAQQLKLYKSGARGTAPGDTFGMQMRPMAMTLADDEAVAAVAEYISAMPRVPVEPSVEGDAVAGKASYAVCATCHGANGEGNQALNAPRLAGQDGWYLKRALQNYKEGRRAYHPEDTFGMQMKPMAMTLADEQAINNVVAYIATLGE